MTRFVKFLRLLIVLAILLLNVNGVLGVGAYPDSQVINQPDGSKLTIQLNGDEWFNWVATTDGYRIVRNQSGVFEYAIVLKSGDIVPSGIKVSDVNTRKPDEREFLRTLTKGPGISSEAIRKLRDERRRGSLKSSTVSTYFPTKGQHKLLVILANFSDTNPLYSRDAFNKYMNETGYNGTGSFKDFYLENSLGQLTINSVVTEWVTLPKPHDYYGPRASWGEFAYTAIKTASEQGVDLSQFDNDGDGIVEGIAIIHQGPGQEVTGNEKDIWSHSWSLASAGYGQTARTFNGVVVNQYTTQPETRNSVGAINTIGVICHEFGHNLGAPDFYDTNGDVDGQYYGTGRWDLMASGTYNGSPSGSSPAHHNPHTKIFYNWINPIPINQPASLTLDPVLTTGKVYRINSPVANEYLLLENRQRTGFDIGLPGKGLLVYHVDGTWINTYRNSNTINIGAHQGLYPIAAGGVVNSSSCPFPGTSGNIQLTDLSNPSMKTWSGEGFNRSLTGIVEVGNVVYFDFMAFQNGSPLSLDVDEVSHSSLLIRWISANQDYPVLLAWSETGVFGTPVNGTPYSPGANITGGGEVLYFGTGLTQYLHNNLQSATKYYYSIWSEKDGAWTSPLKASGITSATPVSSFPWVDGFENGLVQWRQEYVSGQYQWSIRTAGISNKPKSAYEGSNFASFYTSTTSNPVTRLTSPLLNLQAASDYVLEFRHFQASWETDQDQLRVLIKKESGGNWEELAFYNEDESEWIHRRIQIPYHEPVKIAFEGIGKWGYGIGIDQVVIKEANGCTIANPSVSSIISTNVSLSGMTLEWTRGSNDGVLVIARKGNKVLQLPENGVSYTAGSVFGEGDLFDAEAYVVYSGSGSSVVLTGMDHSSYYYYSIFGYNSDGFCYQMEPDRFVFATEMKLHTIKVRVTNGNDYLMDAQVILDGELRQTDENGMAEWQILHRDAYVSLVTSYIGMETKWRKLMINDSQEIDINLSAISMLAPSGLNYTKDYKNVTLKWNPVIDESFDNYPAFALTIPGWTFYDLDKTKTYGFDGIDFPNEGYTGSFIVFDAYSENLLQAGTRFNGHYGRQVLGCVAANGAANNDWIISPVFTVQDGDFISFMARSFTDQYGLERFNVLVSVQEPSPQAYVNISGGTREVPAVWTSYAYALQNYAGKKVRIAIQCVSNDAFIFLLDRIKVGPSSASPSPAELSHVDNPELVLNKKYEQVTVNDDGIKKKQSLVPGDIVPNVGPIGYTVMLGGEVVGMLNGFSKTSLVVEVPECTGNVFSLKTNYLADGVSSQWVDYSVDACYSVIFKVKNTQLLPVQGALVSLDGKTQFTNAEGLAVFNGFIPASALAYAISRDDYDNYSGTVNIIAADREINITLTPTSVNELLLNGSEVRLFPNPARNEVIINGVLPGVVDLQLFDFGGRLVRTLKYHGGNDLVFELNGVTPGVYLVVLKQEKGVWRHKLMVIH